MLPLHCVRRLPSRPLQCFLEFKSEVVGTQPADLQPRMHDEMSKLMKDLTRTLDGVNRDRFQNRLTIFKAAVKEFAKMP